MPKKPIKRGIKVWVLGDSSNGYFSCFDTYTGRREDREVGLGAYVLKKLTEDLKDKYHHIFDNYFDSTVSDSSNQRNTVSNSPTMIRP